MAAVTICSGFQAPKNKVWHCFHCFPIYFPWSDGTRCHNLSFLNIFSSIFYAWLIFFFLQITHINIHRNYLFWQRRHLSRNSVPHISCSYTNDKVSPLDSLRTCQSTFLFNLWNFLNLRSQRATPIYSKFCSRKNLFIFSKITYFFLH